MPEEKLSLTKELWIKMILIVFSGIVGIIVAYTWEYFKFKRETVFERKIDYIIDSRNQAAELFISIDGVRRLIRSQESDKLSRGVKCKPTDFAGQIEDIKSQALRVNYLGVFSREIISGDEIEKNVKAFKDQLKSYIKCLESKRNCYCTNNHKELMNPIRNIINLHTKEINNQIND